MLLLFEEDHELQIEHMRGMLQLQRCVYLLYTHPRIHTLLYMKAHSSVLMSNLNTDSIDGWYGWLP